MADAEPGPTPLLGVAWKFVGGVALLCIVVLAIGLALPGEWRTHRSILIDAPPESIFVWIDTPARWAEWTVWSTVASESSGPPRGPGATLSWDDPYAGEGRFEITAATPPQRLRYRVEVDGGSIVTDGTIELLPEPSSQTRVSWTEEGDFGWNPLLAFAALSMDRIQGTELERSLLRLRHLARGEEIPDSLRPAVEPGAPDSAGAPGP